MENEKTMTIEESFAKLDEIIAQLENKDISIEDSFHAYEEGIKILSACHANLDQVEKRLQKLQEDSFMEQAVEDEV